MHPRMRRMDDGMAEAPIRVLAEAQVYFHWHLGNASKASSSTVEGATIYSRCRESSRRAITRRDGLVL